MLTLGKPLGFLEGRDAFHLIKASTFFTWYIGFTSHMPWLHKIFQNNIVMRTLVGPPPVAKFAEKVVAERLAEERSKPAASQKARQDASGGRSFLSHFIATHQQQPDLMDEQQITISVIGNLLAGSLSPSSCLKELTRYLATNSPAQARLRAELRNSTLSDPAAYNEIKDLPYLTGLIREALRLHPQIVVRQERVAPTPNGLTLPDGTYLPPGTKVGALGHAMTLNREVFGDDAGEFVPERWSRREGEERGVFEERVKRMDRSDMTFGQGSRSCIGKNVAVFEVYKAIVGLVRRYRFEAVDGDVPVGGECMVRVYSTDAGER